VSSSQVSFVPLFSLGQIVLEFLVTLLAIQSGGWFDGYLYSVLTPDCAAPVCTQKWLSVCAGVSWMDQVVQDVGRWRKGVSLNS
jgi:hypothetical protein